MGIDRRTKALHTLFDSIDKGKSGFLHANELRQLIDTTVGKDEGMVLVPDDAELDAFLRLIDENGDMKLSKAEFVLFMLHNDNLLDNQESGIAKWREKVLQTIPW